MKRLLKYWGIKRNFCGVKPVKHIFFYDLTTFRVCSPPSPKLGFDRPVQVGAGRSEASLQAGPATAWHPGRWMGKSTGNHGFYGGFQLKFPTKPMIRGVSPNSKSWVCHPFSPTNCLPMGRDFSFQYFSVANSLPMGWVRLGM